MTHAAAREGTEIHLPLRPSNDGMALFVVLIVFFILSVVVMQLQSTAKIEERVMRTRSGQVEMDLAIESAGRAALMKLRSDWQQDQEDTDATDDGAGGAGNNENPEDPPPGETPPPSGGTGDPATPDTGSGVDSRHEDWAHRYEERINDATVGVQIRDGESRIDLNFLWDYAVPPPSEDEVGTGGSDPPEEQPPPEEETEEPPPEEEAGADPEVWTPPSLEVEQATRDMLRRLIQTVVDYNVENEFEYGSTPDALAASNQIADYVLERQRSEDTRVFRGLAEIERLRDVSSELWYGPAVPKEEDENDEESEGSEEERRTSAPDLLAALLDGQIPFDLDLSGYEELQDGEGIAELPKPLALRDFFCIHSTGKLNLNTIRPQLMAALNLSVEDLEDAQEIAYELDDYLNQFDAEGEEEDEQAGTGGAGSGTGSGTGSGSSAGSGSTDTTDEEEAQPKKFKTFRSLADLEKVNEEWKDPLPGQDLSIIDMLKRDFKKVIYRSEYFVVHLDADRKGRRLQADLSVHRDPKLARIRVLYLEALNR